MPRSRGKFFQADVALRGFPRVRAGGFETFNAAQSYEIQVEAALRGGRPIPKPPSQRTLGASGPTIEDLYNHTLRHHWRGMSDEVRTTRRARYFIDWVGSDTLASAVNSPRMVEFVEHLMEFEVGNSTINHYLSGVSKMWKEGDLKYGIGRFTIPWRKVGPGRKRKITRDEEAEIIRISIKHGLPEFARWAIFLADSGVRRSESLRIRRQHGTVLNSGILQLEVLGTKTLTSHRVIGLPQRCADIFQRNEWDGGDLLFDFTNYQIARWWALIREEMGLQVDAEFVIHTFRHTSVSRQLALGIDHTRVKLFHGHASLKTTEGYAHLSTDALHEMVKTLDAGFVAQSIV